MKFSSKVISAIALLSGIVGAWDVDDRCLRRRALEELPLNSTEPDQNLIEDEEKTMPFNSSVISSTKSLRGSNVYASRNLQSLTMFQIKMYWEEGYCWQEEWRERRWCLECVGKSCDENDYIWLQECSSSSQQKFVYEPVAGSGGGKIKPYSRLDLCWTRTGFNSHQLKPCRDDYTDSHGNSTQIFVGFTFDRKFELHPNGYDDKSKPGTLKCMINHYHHPKPFEIILAESCSVGRRDKTTNWIVLNAAGAVPIPTPPPTPSPTNKATSLSAVAPAMKRLDPRGREYCDRKRCGECMGDCDSDDQCEGNLICFKRGPNERVPGCIGRDSSGTDYCIRPK